MKIAVLGDGGWGTTLALLLRNKGFDVSLWGAFEANINSIIVNKENKKFLPGIHLPDDINYTFNIEAACEDANLIVLAIPSRFLRSILEANRDILKESKGIFVSVTKGLEQKTFKRMSEVVFEALGSVELCVLSGPSIAPEVARNIPTTVVAASYDEVIACEVQDVFRTDRFRVYTNKDVIGVELGGALKNIIAIAVGISDGLGFGANTKAALMTRGIFEISKLGFCLGASAKTFQGLSGLGDLITTCVSHEGRNRGFGERIGRGVNAQLLLNESVMEIEGVWACGSALELGKRCCVELPITQEVYSVVFENKSPLKAVNELMLREPKAE